MKTSLQLLAGFLITFFTFVPVKIEPIRVINNNIILENKKLENTINNKINSIEKDKRQIREIQKELGI